MNLPVYVDSLEVPHSQAQLVTIPIIQIDEMIVRILSARTRGPLFDDKIRTGKRLLVNNYVKRHGNSNIALWRISQLTDDQAYGIMCRRDYH